MQRKTKIITGVTAALAIVTLGSGTARQMHAANNVSAVSQTTAPHTVNVDHTKLAANSTSGTKQNYTVKYAAKGSADSSATFQKKTYGSATLAADQVDYVGSADGPTVKLNHGSRAVVQGTMGHTYVHWTKGDWSVTTVTNNADVTGTPTQFAKRVNTQISQRNLPKKADTGAITVYGQDEKNETNSVSWHRGKQLYQVSGTAADATVKVAQSAN